MKFELQTTCSLTTMLTNRILESQETVRQEQRIKEAFRHPFIVTCVVPYIEDIRENPSFRLVKKFCEENHVPFSAREYNHIRYSEDCDNISEMPAFHLYGRNGHEHWNTYYPKDNPIQKIMEEIIRWKSDQEKKKARKEAWERKVVGLISFFEGLSFKKKPKITVPERPKSLPAKVPIQLPDTLPKIRRGSQ